MSSSGTKVSCVKGNNKVHSTVSSFIQYYQSVLVMKFSYLVIIQIGHEP